VRPHQSAAAGRTHQLATSAPSPLACQRRPPTVPAQPSPPVPPPSAATQKRPGGRGTARSPRQRAADPCARWTARGGGCVQSSRPHVHAGEIPHHHTTVSIHGGHRSLPLAGSRPCPLCATNPPVAHLLCGVLLLHENLQTLISKRSEQDIVCVVLCPFPDMSLAKTAGSGAVDIVYICQYSQVSNSTAQAPAVWWDLEKYNNFEGAAAVR